MKKRWTIACDAAELVVECARAADRRVLSVNPVLVPDVVRHAQRELEEGRHAVLVVTTPPSPEDLTRLGRTAARVKQQVFVAVLGELDANMALLSLSGDLGIIAVEEVAPLACALALVDAGAKRPWAASTRSLPEADRIRLRTSMATARGGGHLERGHEGILAFRSGRKESRAIGEARDVALAITALRAASAPVAEPGVKVEGVDEQAVLNVIFGPSRALSDPASKAALAPYGLPVPTEELCTSPSRAAAEAGRIGFPVRIALASPDLRVWDHPDLAIDGVDNAARVRDVFRQMMTMAEARAPRARMLGVTVTATAAARALLRVKMRPLPEDLVLAELGFADAHGVAAGDYTLTALPAPLERIERVLGRLAGSELLLRGNPTLRRRTAEGVGDALMRLAAFVHDRGAEVRSVEIDPLAILPGGDVEVREACIEVGDSFERSLETQAAG